MKHNLPISYLGNNFKDWFGDFDVEPKKGELKSITFPRPMTDKEIEQEYHPEPVTLEEMAYTLKNLDHSIWAIFYVKDKKGVLRAVGVGWRDGGWSVNAISVEDPDRWNDGYQVFSRNFGSKTLSPSDPESLRNLELRVEKLEQWMNQSLF